MAFIDESGKWIGPGPDPRQIGATTAAPAKFDVNAIRQVSIPQGKTIEEWTNLLNANSGYMGWKLTAAKTADEAAAMRKAAIRSLAVQYGGLRRAPRSRSGVGGASTSRTCVRRRYSP